MAAVSVKRSIGAELRSVLKTIESKLGPINKKFIAFITSLKMQCTLEFNLRYLKCTTAIKRKRSTNPSRSRGKLSLRVR